ncbi:hypothetical protein [Nocardioides pacificus]
MYFDNKPCAVCGSEVELRPHTKPGPSDPDSTVDDRVCTNDDCETNQAGRPADAPRP